ncbi:MAG: PQQ-binding-like beta-propeller repeat protein [Verrucomicrobiales bacterium]|nr:PQQ-binding-like beta-propeller repeat protein [Verrucomicrobiales bacterium]
MLGLMLAACNRILLSMEGAALLFLVLGRPVSAAQEWPQFRGPKGDGHSPAARVPLEWSDSKNVAWKVTVPGRGWSSPVLGDGRVYVTSAIPKGDDGALALSLMALNADNGQVIWSTEVFGQKADAPAIHRKNSHASPTPILAGDRIYVHFGHMGTACLDLAGQVRWRQTSLNYAPVHGNGGSPILVGNLLVLIADGGSDPFVAALKTTDGSVAWRTPRNSQFPRTFSFATPTLIEAAGRRQIIAPAAGLIAAYSPDDGKELWRVRHEGWSVIPKPVFGHGLVFVGTGYETATTLAIRPDADGDATETHVAWTIRRGAPNTPSFLLIGDELYLLADSGVLSCVDARTGSVHYQERACGQSSASPVYAAGRIYLLDEQGLGVVLAPGKEFRKLAENALGERTLASYAIQEGALFIRSEEHLFRIGGPQP